MMCSRLIEAANSRRLTATRVDGSCSRSVEALLAISGSYRVIGSYSNWQLSRGSYSVNAIAMAAIAIKRCSLGIALFGGCSALWRCDDGSYRVSAATRDDSANSR
jgi:hypothetical protein